MPSVVSNRGSGRDASRHALTYGNEELHTPAPSNKRAYAAQRKAVKSKSKFQCRNDRKRPSFSDSGTEGNIADEEDGADGASDDDEDFGDGDDSGTDATEPRARAPSDALRKRKLKKMKMANANHGWLRMSMPSNFSHQAGLEHISVELQTQELTVLEFGPLDQEIEQWEMTAPKRSRRVKRESVDSSSSDESAYKLLEIMSDNTETDGEIERVEDMMVIEDVLASGDLDMGDLDMDPVPMSPFSQNQTLSGMQTADDPPPSYLDVTIPPEMMADALQDLQDAANDSPLDMMQDFGLSPFAVDTALPDLDLLAINAALDRERKTGLLSPSPSVRLEGPTSLLDDPDATDSEDDGNKTRLTVSASTLSIAESLAPRHSSASHKIQKKVKGGRFKLKRNSQHIMMHGSGGKLLTGPKTSTVKGAAPKAVVPAPTPQDLEWLQSSPVSQDPEWLQSSFVRRSTPQVARSLSWDEIIPDDATTNLTISQPLRFMDNITAKLPVSHLDQIRALAAPRHLTLPSDVDLELFIRFPPQPDEGRNTPQL